MITDSLERQFLLTRKHILRISVIENDLGITGKSISKWIAGLKPLPEKWLKPLNSYLYPMLDKAKHKKLYRFDTVTVVTENDISPKFTHIQFKDLRLVHFNPFSVQGADVVYFSFKNRNHQSSFYSIFSKYSQ